MDAKLEFQGKQYEGYYKRIADAFADLLNATTKDAPKHACVHVELSREHGRNIKCDIDVSIKYPLIGNSDNFREIREPIEVSELK